MAEQRLILKPAELQIIDGKMEMALLLHFENGERVPGQAVVCPKWIGNEISTVTVTFELGHEYGVKLEL